MHKVSCALRIFRLVTIGSNGRARTEKLVYKDTTSLYPITNGCNLNC